MTLNKVKEIFGLIFWTILIFVAKYIELSNGCGGSIVYAIGPLAFMIPAHIFSVGMGERLGGWARKKARAEWRENHARMDAQDSIKQLNHYKNMYSNLSTSNPYVNMENTMEDLTINQEQTQFQRQALQQSQKNILSTLRPSVGGSGVAALSQALVRQSERSEERLVADIAEQQVKNRTQALQQRERIQALAREGSKIPMEFRTQQIGAMMGMAQEQYASDKDLQQQYYSTLQRQGVARISSNLSAFNTMLGGMGG